MDSYQQSLMAELKGECMEWKGYGSNGYGQKTIKGKKWLIHRYAWTEAYGEIPKGLHVLHKCDNKSCYNVAHLELGTHAKNIQDAWERGLMKPFTKLTLEQALEIKERSLHENNAALGREFGVSRKTIHGIKKGRAKMCHPSERLN